MVDNKNYNGHSKKQWHEISSDELTRIFAQYRVPDWARSTLGEFWNCSEIGIFDRPYFRLVPCLLADYLQKKTLCSFASLSEDILSGFRSEVISCYQRQHDNSVRLMYFIAYLAWRGIVSLSLAAHSGFESPRLKFILGQRSLYPDKLLAQELIEYQAAKAFEHKPPVWGCSAITEYAELCGETCRETHRTVVAMLRWLDRHYSISSWHDIKPSYFFSLRKARYCGRADFTIFNKFIGYLIEAGLISPVFGNIAGWQSHRFLETDGLNLNCPDSGITPEMLLSTADAVKQKMSHIGYSHSVIRNGDAGIRKFSLFLKEHDLSFDLNLALSWGVRQCQSDYDGQLDMKTGLFVAYKILLGQEVTPEAIVLEYHAIRNGHRKWKVPQWAEDQVDCYVHQRKADGIAGSTIRAILLALAVFTTFLESRGCRDFSKLDAKLVNEFNRQDYHEKSSGKATYNSRIRGFLMYLAGRNVISYNLILALPTARSASEKPPKTLTDEQLSALLEFCDSAVSERQTRDSLALKLALLLGLRASDIIELRFESLDLYRKMLVLKQIKTGKIVSIPVLDSVLEDLVRYLKTDRKDVKNEHIMISSIAPHHHLLSPGSIRKTASSLDCPHFTMHELRKTYATKLVKGGARIDLVTSLIGHSDLSTVHRYLALDADCIRSLCLPLDGLEMGEDLLP